MIAFALAVSLLLLSLPSPDETICSVMGDYGSDDQCCPFTCRMILKLSPGDTQAKFFLCPSYRDGDTENVKPTGRNDPLWLLEKEDEWIPYRTLSDKGERHQPRTFRCFLYYIATFSHLLLDLFTPTIPVYYVYPYYRLAIPQSEPPPNPVISSHSKSLTS